MNWSDYSRFVGDIFGAPLAIEGLLAFFLESTFLGLWIFGWDRLSRKVHLATIWIAAVGTVLSAYFILAANSWMQHPVGYAVNPATGRAELTDFLAVLTNSTALITFPHTIAAAFMTDRRVRRRASRCGGCCEDRDSRTTAAPFRAAAKAGAVMLLVSGPPGRGHRRHPGQDHDRAAADEDGGRRGALRDRAAGLVLDLHDRHARRARGGLLDPDPEPPLVPGHRRPSTARSRASTTSRRSTRRSSGPGDYTPEHAGHLLDLPPDDRRGRAGGRSPRPGSCGPDAQGPARRPAGPSLVGDRCCRSCRSPPTRSAGSSPRWAASRGSCSA